MPTNGQIHISSSRPNVLVLHANGADVEFAGEPVPTPPFTLEDGGFKFSAPSLYWRSGTAYFKHEFKATAEAGTNGAAAVVQATGSLRWRTATNRYDSHANLNKLWLRNPSTGLEDQEYLVGESLTLYVRSTVSGYVTIEAIDPLGNVSEMVPNSLETDDTVVANVEKSWPPGGARYEFQVDPPRGHNVVRCRLYSDSAKTILLDTRYYYYNVA